MPKHKCQFSFPLFERELKFTKEELEGKEFCYQCGKCGRVLVLKCEIIKDMNYSEFCRWANDKTKEGI